MEKGKSEQMGKRVKRKQRESYKGKCGGRRRRFKCLQGRERSIK